MTLPAFRNFISASSPVSVAYRPVPSPMPAWPQMAELAVLGQQLQLRFGIPTLADCVGGVRAPERTPPPLLQRCVLLLVWVARRYAVRRTALLAFQSAAEGSICAERVVRVPPEFGCSALCWWRQLVARSLEPPRRHSAPRWRAGGRCTLAGVVADAMLPHRARAEHRWSCSW